MFYSVMALVAGIVVVQQLPVLPAAEGLVLLLVIALFLGFFRLWRLMFFTIGLLWAVCFASIRLADRLPDELEGRHLQIEGQVIGLPLYDERRVRFDFAVLKSSQQIPGKIKLSWFTSEQQIKAGQRWKMTVKLKKPHGRLNPGGFDYERWLFMQNIGATGYVRNKPIPVLLEAASIWQSFTTIRQEIEQQLSALLPESRNRGLINALAIGERNEVSQQQWEVLRNTGTIHLLAISGLHIGLISGLAYLLAFKVANKLPVLSPQKVAALSAILVAVFYSALAGFSVPTQRALIMLTVAMLAISLQRHHSVKNTLALAMLGVVLVDPLAVLSAGFWLSFLAVAVIVYCVAGRLGRPGYWRGVIKIHLVTALGLSPLLLFYFQQISLIAPVANFIAVPVISLFVVPLCFVVVLAMSFSTALAGTILLLIDNILQGLWLVLSTMAEFPYATFSSVTVPFYLIALALIGLFVLFSPRGMPARWLGCVMLLPILFIKPDRPGLAEVQMTLLDVGQGLASVIQTAEHTLVFDTGAKYSEDFNMGSSVVMPYLQSKGINTVDVLVISHGDNDHIGGAKAVINQSHVLQLLTSVPELLQENEPKRCVRGLKWSWDQVDFEILSPELESLKGENNNSCVLKVSTGQSSVLLTGDIEKEAENWLLENERNKLKSDVLVAPHHGSKTSSSLSFLKQVSAGVVLIPAGYRNRFSFPHKEVISRYEELGASWLNTAEQGAIRVDIKNNHLKIGPMRLENKHYWN